MIHLVICHSLHTHL